VLGAGILLAGVLALIRGQENGYDLRYYHYYIAYAFLNHRLDFDYAPAQLQSYLNPLSFVPFYLLAEHVPATLAGFLLGAWHGLTFGLVFALAHELFRARGTTGAGLPLLCAVLGTLGPVFLGGVGSSANDIPIAQLVVLSLFLILRWWRRRQPGRERASRALMASAVALGMTVGLKLIAATFAIAVLVGFLGLPLPRRSRLRLLGTYGAMLVLGFMVTDGYWMAALWKRFESPTFPFFNAIFRSPYYAPANFADRRFVPQSPFEALTYPFRLASGMHREAAAGFRDARYALLVVLGLPLLLRYVWRRVFRKPGIAGGWPAPATGVAPAAASDSSGGERFLLLFFLIAYVLWQWQFGIARYAATLEAVAPCVMVLLVRRLACRRAVQRLLVALCGVATVGFVRPLDQERITWAAKLIDVQAPRFEQPDRVLVVMAHNAPWSFVLPAFQPEIRVLGLVSNLTKPEDGTRFQSEMREIIARHAGEIHLLSDEGYLQGDLDVLRKHYGLLPVAAPRRRVGTRLQGIPIYLCPMRKSTP
jgi:hypothetical protein